LKIPGLRMGRSAVCVSIVLSGAFALASSPSGYHLQKKIALPAAPGGGEYFDYLTFDPASRRVYISHGTEVKVVDADSNAVVGAISGLKRCHGIAVVNELGEGFITDGEAGEVAVFDTKTLKITGEIKTAPDADAIIYDPASKSIFSFNGDSQSASVIDPVKKVLAKTIPLGGGPEFAAADGKGMVYDNLEDKNEVVAIDSRTLTVKARWPVAPGGGPTALAMDHEHRRLFSAGREPQMLVMMDADTGKVLQSMPISSGADAAVYDADTGQVFVSTREGMIHIFHEDSPDKLSEVETVKTEYGAKTMALDPKTHNIYVTTSDFSAPARTGEQRRRPVPGTFRLLIYTR
jgi:DNA-binding beta-propeller fold protein YncE